MPSSITSFSISTYHHTSLFFDTETCKIVSGNEKKSSFLDIEVRFNDNKLYFIIKNSIINLYLYKFLEDGKVIISNNEEYIPYIENDDKTISIVCEYGFLKKKKKWRDCIQALE